MEGLNALFAFGAALIIAALVILIVAYVITSLACASLNKKAGKSGGLGWIPVYNMFYLYQNIGMLWLSIAYVSVFSVELVLSCVDAPNFISTLVNWISLAITCYGGYWLAKAYNAPQGIQIISAIPFTSFIGLLIVAFSKDMTFNGPVSDFLGSKMGFNKTTESSNSSAYTNYDNSNQYDAQQFAQPQQNQFNQANQFNQQQNQFAQQNDFNNQLAQQQFNQQQFTQQNDFNNQFAQQQFNQQQNQFAQQNDFNNQIAQQQFNQQQFTQQNDFSNQFNGFQ